MIIQLQTELSFKGITKRLRIECLHHGSRRLFLQYQNLFISRIPITASAPTVFVISFWIKNINKYYEVTEAFNSRLLSVQLAKVAHRARGMSLGHNAILDKKNLLRKCK